METKLSKRLRNARISQNLTLREVEIICNNKISNPHIGYLEAGKGIPKPETLRLLSHALKIDYMELMLLAGYVTVRDLKGKI